MQTRFQLPKQNAATPDTQTVFGDGSHPTTLLTARALTVLCREIKPWAVLDIGCGTGVLARIARLEGASHVIGTDIDPLALQVAQENAQLDTAQNANLQPILFTNQEPGSWGSQFDLVVANILEPILVELAPRIAHALKPQGRVLLSGFTALQVPSLEVAFAKQGVEILSHSRMGEWSLIMAHKVAHKAPTRSGTD